MCDVWSMRWRVIPWWVFGCWFPHFSRCTDERWHFLHGTVIRSQIVVSRWMTSSTAERDTSSVSHFEQRNRRHSTLLHCRWSISTFKRRTGDSNRSIQATPQRENAEYFETLFFPHRPTHIHVSRCHSVARGENTLSCLSSFALVVWTSQHKRHMTRFIPFFPWNLSAPS